MWRNDDTAFIASFARLLLGRLRPEHMEHDWHVRLHASDRVMTFPPDLMLVCRVAVLLRGLGLVLRQNVSVADSWREDAAAAVAAAAL